MKTKFIIGLGNPGREYEGTRHNIGFEILNALSSQLQSTGEQSTENSSKKLQSKLITFSALKIVLVYPQTYMNLSGQAVRALIDWYKVKDIQDLLIVHDDVSIPLGKMRWVASGGAGGQHGIESIIQHLGGSKNIKRLKFGIGPDPGGEKRAQYVLGKFPDSQKELLEKSLSLALEGLMLYLKDSGFEQIMGKFNGIDCGSQTKNENI